MFFVYFNQAVVCSKKCDTALSYCRAACQQAITSEQFYCKSCHTQQSGPNIYPVKENQISTSFLVPDNNKMSYLSRHGRGPAKNAVIVPATHSLELDM